MKWMRSRRRQKGFTLIEIMIVVLIIAILLAIAIPNFLRARETSRSKSCQGNLRQIETAKEQWAMDTKAVATATPVWPGDLVTDYIKAAPACPSAGTYNAQDMQTRPTCSIGAQAPADEDYNNHVLP